MAFQWTWPESWDTIKHSIIDSMQNSVRNSMKNNENSSVRGEMVIEDIEFGSSPPVVRLNSINSLCDDKACIDLYFQYKGDASLKISGIEINLDSCVKDTPFFCPFGMKICDFHIESAVRITCSREKAQTYPTSLGNTAQPVTWSMLDDSAFEGERLTSSASLHVVNKMKQEHQHPLQCSLPSSIVKSKSPIKHASYRVQRDLDPLAMSMCLRWSRMSRVHSNLREKDYSEALTSHRKLGYHEAEAEIFGAISLLRSSYSKERDVQSNSIPVSHTVIGPLPMCANVPKVSSLSDHIHACETPMTNEQGAFPPAGWVLMKALHENGPPDSSPSRSRNSPSFERTKTQIHVLFDRNPIQSFAVRSNFSSVEGADEKVVATLRGMLDPIFLSFQKEGLTVNI